MNLSAITEVRKAGVFLEAGIKTIDISFCATIYEEEKHDPILDGDDWEARLEALDTHFKEQGIRVNTTHLPYRYHYENPDEENYAYHYEMTRRSLIASERLGAKCAVVHVNTVDATMAHVKKLFAVTRRFLMVYINSRPIRDYTHTESWIIQHSTSCMKECHRVR